MIKSLKVKNFNLCECGCGNKTSFYRGSFRKYLKGHGGNEFKSKRMINNKIWLGKKHSKKTKEKISKSQCRNRNSMWKGGKAISNGYVSLLCKSHPFADINGRVKQERLIVEKYLRRYLDLNEVVHHKNENRTDNRIENLEVMTRSEHARLHSNKRWKARKLLK